MMSAPFYAITRILRRSHPERWAVLGLASILLHLFLLRWAGGEIGLPSLKDQKPSVIVVEFHAAPLPPQALPDVKVPRPSVKRPSVKRKARLPAPQPTAEPAEDQHASAPAGSEAQDHSFDAISATGAVTDATTDTTDATTDTTDATTDATAAILPGDHAKQADASIASATAPPEPAAVHYNVDPPPSAELKYDVHALKAGTTFFGKGSINWHTDGQQYAINGAADFLFFTVLTFKSEGALDELGLAPLLYTEKSRKKSATNTHFHRERNTISFSASTLSYPRTGGEQDRVSVIWQLASIGRGDREQFKPGAEIDVFVAGVRDAEIWRIHIIGEEDIELGTGMTKTWHVVRVPRPGSYDQKLDIWLAPQHEWQPVKLRYTETNGDYLDLSLSSINLATPR